MNLIPDMVARYNDELRARRTDGAYSTMQARLLAGLALKHEAMEGQAGRQINKYLNENQVAAYLENRQQIFDDFDVLTEGLEITHTTNDVPPLETFAPVFIGNYDVVAIDSDGLVPELVFAVPQRVRSHTTGTIHERELSVYVPDSGVSRKFNADNSRYIGGMALFTSGEMFQAELQYVQNFGTLLSEAELATRTMHLL